MIWSYSECPESFLKHVRLGRNKSRRDVGPKNSNTQDLEPLYLDRSLFVGGRRAVPDERLECWSMTECIDQLALHHQQDRRCQLFSRS